MTWGETFGRTRTGSPVKQPGFLRNLHPEVSHAVPFEGLVRHGQTLLGSLHWLWLRGTRGLAFQADELFGIIIFGFGMPQPWCGSGRQVSRSAC